MGGTVALEMAQQLKKAGDEVALLAFFETYNWDRIENKSFFDDIYYYVQKFEFHLKNLIISDHKSTFFSEKAREAKNRAEMWFKHLKSNLIEKNHSNKKEKITLAQLWENNDRAALDYKPKKYPGKITFFKPKKEYALNTGSGMDWKDIAQDGVEIHELPVYPAAMLVEPFVPMLATKLTDCIKKTAN
jgi:phthiocerol/phenolphthiocerol synthesis type-I polyketide synthase E